MPRSSVTVLAPGSTPTTRRPSWRVAPVASVLRQMLASGSPFHNALESGGRLYGGCGSAAGRPAPPLAATSPRAPAARAGGPPPPPPAGDVGGDPAPPLPTPAVAPPPTGAHW